MEPSTVLQCRDSEVRQAGTTQGRKISLLANCQASPEWTDTFEGSVLSLLSMGAVGKFRHIQRPVGLPQLPISGQTNPEQRPKVQTLRSGRPGSAS